MLNSTLTLFCRELDRTIEAYESDLPLGVDLADLLAALQYLLDEHVDQGIEPSLAFDQIQKCLNHDLENFLYDVIADELDMNETTYAIELLEGFWRYVNEKQWFKFLEIRAEIQQDPEEGFEKLERLLCQQKKEGDLLFLLEILCFLGKQGSHTDFLELALFLLPKIEREGDFQDYLTIVANHYRALSLLPLALKTEELLAAREEKPDLLDQKDLALDVLKEILHQKLAI